MNAADRKLDSPRITRTLRALGLAAAVVLAVPAHGQACSGGSAGGTDATGNQCNDPVAISASGDRSGAAPSATTPEPAATAPSPRVSAGVPATSTPPMKAAAHRKKVFDERRARFEDVGHPRVAAAPGTAASNPRRAP